MKLSKTQIEVLIELSKEGNYLNFMRYMGRFNPNTYWYFHSNLNHVRCATVDRLKKYGLIDIVKDSLGYPDEAFINKYGRLVLKKNG